jgi:hypothetical protein
MTDTLHMYSAFVRNSIGGREVKVKALRRSALGAYGAFASASWFPDPSLAAPVRVTMNSACLQRPVSATRLAVQVHDSGLAYDKAG